ncbi:MAG: hypothetical protein GY697_12125 [Desulfobacterales bacterium]|nr:hypothetical protein [Desulfobacterales bacterium]
MKFRFFVSILLIILPLTGATAQVYQPNLVGEWLFVENDGISYKGKAEGGGDTRLVLNIKEQHGRLFKGTFSWLLSENNDHLHDGTKYTHKSTEDIIGVIGYDGTTLTIAEHPDTGYQFGKLIDENTLELVLVESGPHAIAAYALAKRQ